MLKLSGLHFLLTYQCIFECEHCFVWGSPAQGGTFTLEQIRKVLNQASDVRTIKSIYFEGGEPFLYYPILVKGIKLANRLGFKTGIVTNGYWANSEKDAVEWLKPFKGVVSDLSISSDLYHYDQKISKQSQNIKAAAGRLDIPVGIISIAQPEDKDSADGKIMYRGRAAEKLASKSTQQDWSKFTTCPYEDLENPRRVHVDAYGNLHICQGISIGNLFKVPLKEICKAYKPHEHPIVGPLLEKGPAGLVGQYKIRHKAEYADACHLCYESRRRLLKQFPQSLCPTEMYGI
jgi:organic radical activating enzyme